jgi:hypothetical protein
VITTRVGYEYPDMLGTTGPTVQPPSLTNEDTSLHEVPGNGKLLGDQRQLYKVQNSLIERRLAGMGTRLGGGCTSGSTYIVYTQCESILCG